MKMIIEVNLSEEIIDYESLEDAIKRIMQDAIREKIEETIRNDKKFHKVVKGIKDHALNKALIGKEKYVYGKTTD